MISFLLSSLRKRFQSSDLGRTGEKKAVKFLKQKHHKIRTVNFRTRLGEIDIISELPGMIIFTEVKTGTIDSYRNPLYAVNNRKTKRILKTAGTYIRINKIKTLQPRYDIITVIKDGTDFRIEHYENAI